MWRKNLAYSQQQSCLSRASASHRENVNVNALIGNRVWHDDVVTRDCGGRRTVEEEQAHNVERQTHGANDDNQLGIGDICGMTTRVDEQCLGVS